MAAGPWRQFDYQLYRAVPAQIAGEKPTGTRGLAATRPGITRAFQRAYPRLANARFSIQRERLDRGRRQSWLGTGQVWPDTTDTVQQRPAYYYPAGLRP